MRPYRKEKLESLIHEIVSDIIARSLNDPRVAPLTTVTRVELSGDLAFARVYVSVHADAAAERGTMRAIQHAGGYVQRMLAGRLAIRQCPQLRFEVDEGAKTALRTMKLLEENRQHLSELQPPEQDMEPES